MIPAVSVILTAHLNPYLGEALASLEAQTRRDFECILMDSGQWIGQHDEGRASLFGEWSNRPWLEWRMTGEAPGLRDRACPVSVATNLAIRGGLRGRYVCHFYEDDEYDPRFIEAMAGYLDEHPDERAVWCSQARTRIGRDGSRAVETYISAYDGLAAGAIDCRVDGGQVMYHRSVLDALGDPWMNEDPGQCGHSDGIFLERVAQVTGPINAIGGVLMAHRFTPYSTYSPT